MTSRERMAAAMAGATPDRVPVMCQMSIGHMLVATGVRPAALWLATETHVGALLALRQRYGFDGILVSLHGHAPDWEKRVDRAEPSPGGERVRWKSGGTTVFPADDLPTVEPGQPLHRPEFARFDPASLPETLAYIPVSQGLRFALDREHLFDAVVKVVERAGRDFSVHGEVTSPLDYFLDLFGFEEAMVGCLEDPGRAAAVLDRFAAGLVGLSKALAATGVDAIKLSSPFAGAGFLSTAFYKRFVLPFERRIVRAIEARGVRAYIHTCGDIHDRLELMADSGASGIECLDPPPLGRTELAEAKARIGGRVFIKGNIDPVHVLLAGDRETVRADAARRIAVGRPGGRYILSTACSIAPHTPPENIAVLAEVAESRGRS
jgi:MtaA/CmuA family methyltransferase